MPERTLPTHPDFGYFTDRPHIIIDRDPDDEYTVPGLPALSLPSTSGQAYPTRQDDKADEVERLQAQLTSTRDDARAWKAAYNRLLDVYEKQLTQLEQARAEWRKLYKQATPRELKLILALGRVLGELE